MAAVGGLADVAGLAHTLVLDANAVHRTSRGVAGETEAPDRAERLVAAFAGVAGTGAVATVAADLVDALAAVLAGTRDALVYVELAVLALEARLALAYVAAVVVVTAHRVQAGIAVGALVDVLLAVDTGVPERMRKL